MTRRGKVPPVGPFARVAVLGGGAWGTALALVAARADRDTVLWARDAATVTAINETATNPAYLPGLGLDPPVAATTDPAVAASADLVIAAVPTQSLRATLALFAPIIRAGTPVVSAAKGLERGSHDTPSAVIAATLPRCRPAVLSGPSFAVDVAKGLPTALTIAAVDMALAERIAETLASPSFRPYASDDIVGVELGGALKNIIAIAAGIVAGRGLGASAQAALTARGFAEMSRLAARLGARPSTLMGLSGLGDLMLSTASAQSRNFSLGLGIGAGRPLSELTGPGARLAEGAFTAAVAIELAGERGVEMPIAHAVADVLAGALSVDAAVVRLMTRPLKAEAD
ncbi:MAG: NAD(P)-dependent glycerol-3-phosphate dehydrogenase [Ancalomicrobiaceae bacterium]|nr:NAD(P)-dependent glycerol-3-phosphate dehydrogenase [Ancalomicrobiaceae bacterium]